MFQDLYNEWARNNPEQARAVDNIPAFLNKLGEKMRPHLETLCKVGEELRPFLETVCPEIPAARYKKRYEETGDAIQMGEAIQLAFQTMVFTLPYTGPEPNYEDASLFTIRAHEMLAIIALHHGHLAELIEDSETDTVAYDATQQALRHLRESSEEIPRELHEWAYDVATDLRTRPKTGPGRNPSTNRVRDATIIRTMEILVSCGLQPTRNEATEPAVSAADAVSEALKAHRENLEPGSVAKIWTNRNNKKFPDVGIVTP